MRQRSDRWGVQLPSERHARKRRQAAALQSVARHWWPVPNLHDYNNGTAEDDYDDDHDNDDDFEDEYEVACEDDLLGANPFSAFSAALRC